MVMVFVDDEAFLLSIKGYVEDNPHIAARVTDFVQAGLNSALDKERSLNCDLESIVAILMAARYRGKDEIIARKLHGLKGQTRFNWDHLLKKHGLIN